MAARIEAFSNVVGFLTAFAISASDSGGVDALQCSQPLRTRLEGIAVQVHEYCLRGRIHDKDCTAPTRTSRTDPGRFRQEACISRGMLRTIRY